MQIEDIKISIQQYELKKLERILNLCNSPIEELFVANIYNFFLSNGFVTKLLTQQSTGVRIRSDSKIDTLYHISNNDGLTIELKKGKNEYQNPLTGEPERIVGFQINCIDVIYRIFPQHPIFDEKQVRYADFVIEILDADWNHLDNFVIECDGFAWHSSREQLEKDNNRNTFITKQGYKIIRYTGSQISKLNEQFIIDFENTIYHSIFKKNSNLYNIKMY